MSKTSKKSAHQVAREAIQKKIESQVDKYLEQLKTEGKTLQNTPEELNAFFVSGALAGLSKIESLAAKTYFKSKLPYTQWRERIAKDPDALADDIIHFRELEEGNDR